MSGGTSIHGVLIQNEKPCPISLSTSCVSFLHVCWLDDLDDYSIVGEVGVYFSRLFILDLIVMRNIRRSWIH